MQKYGKKEDLANPNTDLDRRRHDPFFAIY